MSETTALVLKTISAITSPKAAIKFISIGTFIVLAWWLIPPIMINFNVPPDGVGTVVLFIGIGSGVLFAELMSFLYSKYQNSQKENSKKIAQENIEQLALDKERTLKENFLSEFKCIYEHIRRVELKVLRNLTIDNIKFCCHEDAIKYLSEIQAIFKVTTVRGTDFIYEINPAIKAFIADHWDQEVQRENDTFIYQTPHGGEPIFELFKSDNQNSRIDYKVLVSAKNMDCFSYREVGEPSTVSIEIYNPNYKIFRSTFEHLFGLDVIMKQSVRIDPTRIIR